VNLLDRVALVTGAAHRVGRGIALALARAGVGVAVHYGRSREEAERTADDLRSFGVRAEALQADLRDPAAIDALFEAFDRAFDRLDILVNSAASFNSEPFEDITAGSWDAVLALNLRAPFLLTQRAAVRMRRAQREGSPGLVVNLSDLSAFTPWRGFTHHGVSKAALLQLTRAAALELAPHVRVNAIVPGAILPPPGQTTESPAWRAKAEMLPLRRTGSPALVGKTVIDLAENDFITGIALPLDGGEHLVSVRDARDNAPGEGE
jgi:pteridine reductase